MITRFRQLTWLTVAVLGSGAGAAEYDVTMTPTTNGAVEVRIDGSLFTIYRHQDADRPFFYPVLGPGGQAMTRKWPMEKAEGEATDHMHHRGLWYTHGDMNGLDFWSERAGPKTVQTRSEMKPGGILVTENAWRSATGKTVCTDRRTHHFSAGKGYRQIDLTVRLFASAGRLVMGDTKEGSMAIRLPATLRVQGDVASGMLYTSEAIRDGKVWGSRAAWCASVGPVDGQTVGVTIMDHPSNPRHPTWWHARTYGLVAANAVGQHYFEKKPAGTGDLVLESGDQMTFRYRIFFHEGNTGPAEIDSYYQAFKAKKTEDNRP